MEKASWIVRGGWIDVSDEMPPTGRIVEVCQYMRDDIKSAPDTMSFQLASHPEGNWHWEPEGHVSSVEPSHWRPLPSTAAMLSAAIREPAIT